MREFTTRPKSIHRLFIFTALLTVCATLACQDRSQPELVGLAVLPADTFVAGPTSGQFIQAANGRTPPFVRQQPVQGFSALLYNRDGSFLVLPDNGFGSLENSPDFLLRVYRIVPEFKTANGGSGRITLAGGFLLRDPDHRIAFTLVADRTFYPSPGRKVRVDSTIRAGRLLTGADFDPESFRRLPDGTFIFGDEFGPFLLHTDSTGRVLRPPISLPGVFSPQNPYRGHVPPNLPRSGGFEAMALSPDGLTLYPMLEKPLRDQPGQVNLYEFDLESMAYTHVDPYQPPYKYRLEPEAVGVTELTALDARNFLVIERDAGQGPTARHKKIYRVNLDRLDDQGYLVKTEVVDLLNLADPHDLSGSGTGVFVFPFETTEALARVDRHTLAITNDNNYPFGKGRAADAPDHTELILVRSHLKR